MISRKIDLEVRVSQLEQAKNNWWPDHARGRMYGMLPTDHFYCVNHYVKHLEEETK